MADQKISQLSSGAPAQAGDEYVVARSGANYKLTGTNVAALVAGTANTFSATQSFSNPAEFADGSASAPSVTNTGDTNTGVYFPAADEVAVSAGGTVAAGFNSNGLFFRNRVINGDMRIDQRNAGAAVTHSGASNLYVLDRWACNSTGTPQFSVQQVADAPTGFVNSSKLTTTTAGTPAAGDFSYYLQYIEGLNVADLNFGTASALTVTLSFWVKSSLTGTFGGALKNGAVDRAYPFSYTINSAGTWEYKTVTIPGDTTGTWLTTNGIGMSVAFDTGSGANNKGTAGAWNATANLGVTGGVNLVATAAATWQITGVQLETGSVATPFERRPYGTELMLCQRYYYRIRPGATGQPLAFGANHYTTASRTNLMFPVEMRIAPTALEQSGTANQYAVSQSGIGNTVCDAVPVFSVANTRFATVNATVASGLTQFNPCTLSTDTTNGATAYLGWSAEL